MDILVVFVIQIYVHGFLFIYLCFLNLFHYYLIDFSV